MTNSKQPKDKHPGHRQLSAFLNGKLSAKAQVVVERHIAACDLCCNRLQKAAHEPLGDRLLALSTQFDSDSTHFDSKSTMESEDASSLKNAVQQPASGLPELKLDRYELLDKIGTGGMGEVYRAKQTSMDREVAIKILRRHLFSDERAVARFKNEVKIAAQLNHPNIVHSYDSDAIDGTMILVMELVEGQKLSDYVSERGQLGPEMACQLVNEIVKGLDYAQRKGMIHRDIKPQNVLIREDNSIKIADFGLARLMRNSTGTPVSGLTMEGETFGTPDYVAPEQIRDSSDADCRADIYSLGCTLYFMLTGRPPFTENSVGEKLAGHLDRTPDSITQFQPEITPALVALVEKMMEKDRDQRFQNYREIQIALQELSQQRSSRSNKANPVTTGKAVAVAKADRSTPLLTTRSFALCLGFLLVVAMGWIFWPLNTLQPKTGQDSAARKMTPSDTNRKRLITIVVPRENAYHPELAGLHGRLTRHPDVRIQYVADRHGDVTFSRQRSMELMPTSIAVHQTLSEIKVEDSDALIFTGAWNGNDSTDTRYAYEPSLNNEAKRVIGEMLKRGKPVAALCGGIVVLAKSNTIRGRKVANCRYISQDVKRESGAIWSPEIDRDADAVVVQDDLIITGGNAINCIELSDCVLKTMGLKKPNGRARQQK